MSKSNTPAIERVILCPEHTCVQALAFFHGGRADAEQVRSWAMTSPLDLTSPAECGALLAMVPANSVAEIFAAQARLSKVRAERGAALRVTFSAAGRVVLNGVKLNQSADGKGGMPLSLYPAQLSAIVDALPLLLTAVCDKAEATYAADEKDKIYNPAYDERLKSGRKAGKSDESIAKECKEDGIPKYVDVKHPRAGKTVAEWSGVDRAAAVAKFRAVIDALRAVGAK